MLTVDKMKKINLKGKTKGMCRKIQTWTEFVPLWDGLF